MTQIKLATKNLKNYQFKSLEFTNTNLASVILNLKSRDILGNKQTIILHNFIINNKRYDLVVTAHKQTIEYKRTKRQTLRKKIINKQKQILRKRF